MPSPRPRWRRRKPERPAEIIQAALSVFADLGFAAAKLDEIARRAGVAKGSLYSHFATKDALFRAVVQTAIAPSFEALRATSQTFDGPFPELVSLLLVRAAVVINGSRLPSVARMVISESRTFPDLARVWHDDVVSRVMGLLAELVAGAQERGEVRAGDARLHAFSIFGPLVMALLYGEVFAHCSSNPPDLPALAEQHAQTVLRGLLTSAVECKEKAP